jgi:hypothetical protein
MRYRRDLPGGGDRNLAVPASYAPGVPTADHRITLLTREGCHLCDDAREIVRRVAAEVGSSWGETDVDGDPGLRAEYGDLVPVVLVDGKEHGYWRIEEPRLRRALAR